ncbi:MAG: hypothetical protein HPY71_14585 [Firmicutes bacterium]|nr:hypothetical protein [Bacillota bacterium]
MAKERKCEMAREAALAASQAAKACTALVSPKKRQHHRKTPRRAHSKRRNAHRRKPGFSPERQSGYSVNRKGGTLTASRVHGLVVNELARELAGMGIEVANTGLGGETRPDLAIFEPLTVIEVKAEGDWTDVIRGVGQCYVYGDLLGDHTTTGKILVVPAWTDPEKAAVLFRLGIRAVKWREKEGEISFTGLKRALFGKGRKGA